MMDFLTSFNGRCLIWAIVFVVALLYFIGRTESELEGIREGQGTRIADGDNQALERRENEFQCRNDHP